MQLQQQQQSQHQQQQQQRHLAGAVACYLTAPCAPYLLPCSTTSTPHGVSETLPVCPSSNTQELWHNSTHSNLQHCCCCPWLLTKIHLGAQQEDMTLANVKVFTVLRDKYCQEGWSTQ